MKRSWIFYAFLASSMLWLAPSANAATVMEKTSFSHTILLNCDYAPWQVREVLRKTRRATGVQMSRLVRMYRNGRLTMQTVADGLVQVTIQRQNGPVVVLIETSF